MIAHFAITQATAWAAHAYPITMVCGLMGMGWIESNLVAGAQKLVPGQPLVYGKSITDGCIDWSETRVLLAELAEAVCARRNSKIIMQINRAPKASVWSSNEG